MIIPLPIAKLKPHPDNAKLFSDSEGEQWDFFKNDIQKNGILQPLLVTGNDETGYTVLSGHQRLKAATALEWDSVSCILWEGKESPRDVLFSANLGRQLTTMERFRMTMHLLEKMEDNRKDNRRGGKVDSGPNSQNQEKPPRDRVAAMVPGITTRDITTFRRIKELPEPVQKELFQFVENENPNKKELKEKVNALNADRRRLKTALREEKKIRHTRREMEQMKDYLAAEKDPREVYEARMYDAVNKALHTACIEITTLVAAVFAHGPVRDRTAERLRPGIMALSDILKEQRSLLLEGWRNRNRELEEVDRHNDAQGGNA